MAILTLVLLLAACGGAGKGGQSNQSPNGTSANPVKQAAPTMTTTPTANAQVTGSATPGKSALTKTYTGDGYTIQYPATWKVTTSTTGIAFTDPTGSYNLTIGSSADPNGVKTSDQLAQNGIEGAKANLKDVQTVSLPATTMVAGQTWSQRAISGNSTINGQTSAVQAVVLANDHPAHATTTRGNVIVYVALKDHFSQAQSEYFQPMLDSFKYTA